MNNVVLTDGGRVDAGYKGKTGDCSVRAVSIVTGKPYQEIYDALRPKKGYQGGVKRSVLRAYLKSLGWTWVPTMFIGQGCKVHLRANELPKGKLICQVSKHFVAVIDGVVYDNHDCTRNGSRCVYGYYCL